MHIYDSRPDANARMLMEMGERARPARLLTGGKTALSAGLSDFQKQWLLHYCIDQWAAYHSALVDWRSKLEKYERMADDDYTDRTKHPDPERTNALKSIFEKQNHTLGVVSGFCDFVYAQARDDVFGTRPWLAATPQGMADNKLAELVTKHSQWKFDQSNIEDTLCDTIRSAIDLGTQFVKIRWVKDVETYETAEYVAFSISANAPILAANGDYITKQEDLEGIIEDGADVEWREMLIEQTETVYNNIVAENLDFKDVAFDVTAPELKLDRTDFFHRFRIGILDAISFYGLDEEKALALRDSVNRDDSSVRDHRGEIAPGLTSDWGIEDKNANPQVTMVEGFVRVDPFQKGQAKRLHVVFIPDVNVLIYCDYLANTSPGGIIPVFPVRCFKVPNRIIGRGYFEKYEDADTAIDGQYNAVTYHNRRQSVPFVGIHKDALADDLEGRDIVIDPERPFELAPDKTMKDFMEFLSMPDLNGRSVELMNQMLQLAQMRSGITSASQGELKGVPNANTATGVRQLVSRGATLVRWPIDQMMGDLERPVEYSVILNYANQDLDETFVWGEGRDAELMEIRAGDVKGLRANVSLRLTQSQNQNKLENAMAATEIGIKYAQLPEVEKQSQRRLYVQAVSALGFNDAEKIIREAVFDTQGILSVLPPEMQETFAAFLHQNGMMAPEQPQPE